MEHKPYHHGNLREALIEEGIRLVNQSPDRFSLRGVAAACGVSHAAPYNHFASKEELIDAMQEHITAQFTAAMQEVVLREGLDSPDMLCHLGQAYVDFFSRHPQYFRYFITGQKMDIRFTNDRADGDYPPFVVFRDAALARLEACGVPPEDYVRHIVARWAVVHGLASLAAMPGIAFDGDLIELTGRILRENIR